VEVEHALIAGIDFVILPFDQQEGSGFKKGASAELSIKDLENINKILHMAVENYNDNAKLSWENKIDLNNYKRQYIAIINRRQEKEVFINCFNDKHIEDSGYWKNEYIIVFDGGNNFFNVKINITKMTYYDFQTNGYA
jgi:hypothetical protein